MTKYFNYYYFKDLKIDLILCMETIKFYYKELKLKIIFKFLKYKMYGYVFKISFNTILYLSQIIQPYFNSFFFTDNNVNQYDNMN